MERRDFLRRTALAGGGLVLAVHVPGLAAAADAPAALADAYLRVEPGSGTVTVLVARTEMGQGSSTALAMLVAEELRTEWSQVRIEQAVPADVYGDMTTGGSASIRTLWKPMRRAGAQARTMLVEAAARRWKVAPSSCLAEQGGVTHAPTGRRLAYGALATAAAALAKPEPPALRPAQEFTLIGTSPARLDGPAKVEGSAVFGMDVRRPGMLFATLARCPVTGGRAASFDASEALKVPGVTRVERLGDHVAVLATGTWAAFLGREALRVDWDEGPLAGLDSAGIRARFVEKAQGPAETVRREGRGAAGLVAAARTVEAVYEVPYLAHAALEPMCCTAHVRPGAVEVWVPTQSGSGARAAAAKAAGLAPAAVTVHMTQAGGAFGGRHRQDVVEEAVRLSALAGAPVQVGWTREDDIQHDRYRPAAYNVMRAGLDAGGALVAWSHRIVAPGIATQMGILEKGSPDWSSFDGAYNLPYAVPDLEVDLVTWDPGVPLGWWRSVSASQNAYVVESFLDEVAVAAGRDPLELRLALLKDKPRHRAVLERAAREAGWGTPPPAGRTRGLAVHECFGSVVADVAEVEVAGGAVRVRRMTCAVDCGIAVHPDLVRQQMESGIVYGLSAALKGEITLAKGRVEQTGFGDYPMVTIDECPAIDVHLELSGVEPIGGIGEPGLPPVAPAVANAVARATGKPVRRLPIVVT